MDWTAFAAVSSVCVTLLLGMLTISRGHQTTIAAARSAEALNLSQTVQASFQANLALIDQYQEETQTSRERILECEKKCAEARREAAEAYRQAAAHEAALRQAARQIQQLERQLAALQPPTQREIEGS